MAEVVGLNGEYIPVPGEPQQECIELLEQLLADAKAGNIMP